MKNINFNFDNTYIKLDPFFYSRLNPSKVKKPQLVVINNRLSEELGLDFSGLSNSDLADFFSGNKLPPNSEPLAQAYAGHQFGNFTMLGDGRAILIGEHVSPTNTKYDIQFKGSGITPYSRSGDGKAALSPMLREYLISEAMFNLKIPTTRSLCVVNTGELVFREKPLDGAILTRIASSHIRIGTFQYACLKNDKSLLMQLFDYTQKRHFNYLTNKKNIVLSLLNEFMKKQIDLVVNWMRVGFIHGVMNTDNITLSGETIDYGPCAFMNQYNPKQVFSSIDYSGRYSFINQSRLMQWNLARFAETLIPLISDDKQKSIVLATNVIEEFDDIFNQKWLNMMKKKLGLFGVFDEDKKIIDDLLFLMEKYSIDYTNTFSHLTSQNFPKNKFFNSRDFKNWNLRWKKRLKKNNKNKESIFKMMGSVNPEIIPRNKLIESILEDACKQKYNSMTDFLSTFLNPYSKSKQVKRYQSKFIFDDDDYQTYCGT